MTKEKSITCIICPKGCNIKAWEENGELKLEGFSCKRGKTYATSEYYNPSRLLATTIRISNARIPLIPVKSSEPIPKTKLMEVMDDISKVVVNAPVIMGDVLIENVSETGINIVATRSLEKLP